MSVIREHRLTGFSSPVPAPQGTRVLGALYDSHAGEVVVSTSEPADLAPVIVELLLIRLDGFVDQVFDEDPIPVMAQGSVWYVVTRTVPLLATMDEPGAFTDTMSVTEDVEEPDASPPFEPRYEHTEPAERMDRPSPLPNYMCACGEMFTDSTIEDHIDTCHKARREGVTGVGNFIRCACFVSFHNRPAVAIHRRTCEAWAEFELRKRRNTKADETAVQAAHEAEAHTSLVQQTHDKISAEGEPGVRIVDSIGEVVAEETGEPGSVVRMVDKAKEVIAEATADLVFDPGYPDPPSNIQVTPMFRSIWNAIKGWDLERVQDAGRAGATGNDVMRIMAYIEPVVQAVQTVADTRAQQVLEQIEITRALRAEVDKMEGNTWKDECLDALRGTSATSIGGLISHLRAQRDAASRDTKKSAAIAHGFARALALPDHADHADHASFVKHAQNYLIGVMPEMKSPFDADTLDDGDDPDVIPDSSEYDALCAIVEAVAKCGEVMGGMSMPSYAGLDAVSFAAHVLKQYPKLMALSRLFATRVVELSPARKKGQDFTKRAAKILLDSNTITDPEEKADVRS